MGNHPPAWRGAAAVGCSHDVDAPPHDQAAMAQEGHAWRYSEEEDSNDQRELLLLQPCGPGAGRVSHTPAPGSGCSRAAPCYTWQRRVQRLRHNAAAAACGLHWAFLFGSHSNTAVATAPAGC